MKIVYVISDYTNSGGMERVLSNKANYLAGEGFDVNIIAYVHKNIKPFFHFDERISFHHIDGRGYFNDQMSGHKETQVFVDMLEEVLLRIKPDITVAMASGLGFEVCRCKDGSKKILESHFSKYKGKAAMMVPMEKSFFLRFIPDYYRRRENKRAGQFDCFALLTYEDKDSWSNLNNLVVIPNSLSFIPDKKSDMSTKRAITFARITNQKGLDMLIDIWKRVAETHPDWVLDIYGDGSKRKKGKLIAKTQKLGISSSVNFHPATENVAAELQKSSIFVMTSRYEGFGLALTEAMACGVPPVAFACKCGPKDIINEGEDGFLTAVNDKKVFAERLRLLMDSADLRVRMGHRASQNILRFSEDRVMGMWIDLFRETVAGKR